MLKGKHSRAFFAETTKRFGPMAFTLRSFEVNFSPVAWVCADIMIVERVSGSHGSQGVRRA